MAKTIEFHAPGMDTTTRSEAGVDMPVYRPDNTPLLRTDGKPVVFTLMGPDSAAYRAAEREQRKTTIERSQAGERTPEQQDEDVLNDRCAFIARMMKGWNVQLSDGKDAPTDPDTVMAFLRAFPAALDQADRFVGRRVGFMKAS